jgi:hypothetical protein
LAAHSLFCCVFALEQKSQAILRILTQNKKNFLAFLDEFERDSEDEVLVAHKQEMSNSLLELPDSVPPVPKKTSAASSEESQQAAQQVQAQQQQVAMSQEQLP